MKKVFDERSAHQLITSIHCEIERDYHSLCRWYCWRHIFNLKVDIVGSSSTSKKRIRASRKLNQRRRGCVWFGSVDASDCCCLISETMINEAKRFWNRIYLSFYGQKCLSLTIYVVMKIAQNSSCSMFNVQCLSSFTVIKSYTGKSSLFTFVHLFSSFIIV